MICRIECLCVNLLLVSLTVYPSTQYKTQILNRHGTRSAQVSNSFVLTVYLEVILGRRFRIDNRKSLYFNRGIKADKKRKLKLKIS